MNCQMNRWTVLKLALLFVACVASHLDRLLLSVSCGKDTKPAAKLNSLPSNQRPHDLDSVYWTPGPTWKSSDRDREFCGQEERSEKQIHATLTLSHSKTNLNLMWRRLNPMLHCTELQLKTFRPDHHGGM